MKFIGTVTKVDLTEAHKVKLTIEATLTPDDIGHLAGMVGDRRVDVEVSPLQPRLPEEE